MIKKNKKRTFKKRVNVKFQKRASFDAEKVKTKGAKLKKGSSKNINTNRKYLYCIIKEKAKRYLVGLRNDGGKVIRLVIIIFPQ